MASNDSSRRVPAVQRRAFASIAAVILFAGTTGFGLWCAIDWFHVRGRPFSAVTDAAIGITWLVGVPIIALAAAPNESKAARGCFVIAATALSVSLALFLILFLGIPFHLSIGGRL